MIVSSPPKFFAGTVVLGGTPAEFNLQGYASGSIANTSSGGLLDILLVKAGSGETQKMRLIAGTALNFVNLALSQITISVSSESSINSVNFQILYYTKKPETDYEVVSLEAASSMWLSTVGLGTSSSVDITAPVDSSGNVEVAVENTPNVSPTPSSWHQNLAKVLGASVAAGGDILSSAVTMPFAGTALIDIYVSAATDISVIINGGSAQTIYSFGGAGYAHLELELASGDTLQLQSSAAATITCFVGARA
ncbi:MAG: hypothetical protein RXR82_06085 [Nitrososphaeria archaeon]